MAEMNTLIKESMTTGQVAALLEVSARTVSKWGDSGKLKHWKINKDRRFSKADVFEFAKQNGFSRLLAVKGVDDVSAEMESKDLQECIAKMKKYKAACDAANECFRSAKFNLENQCYQVPLDSRKKFASAVEEANR